MELKEPIEEAQWEEFVEIQHSRLNLNEENIVESEQYFHEEPLESPTKEMEFTLAGFSPPQNIENDKEATSEKEDLRLHDDLMRNEPPTLIVGNVSNVNINCLNRRIQVQWEDYLQKSI